ncbi:MAG: DNA translocase FtsK 4TM domain-containing protein [Sedimentisphaerales bacterium]|nr:DNA translocase FtsK 4TM domain-containing protein [Sedimentisphaerales bacterium]
MAKRVEIRRTYKIAIECSAIAVLLLLLCSCLSFDIGDWPSRYVYPNNRPTENLCGMIGAFAAYYLLYYIGPGVFLLLISGIMLLAVRLFDKTLDQLILRSVGMALLTAAASASFYCLWPDSIYEFPIGSGGVLGVGAVKFLGRHFATLGTLILVGATWVVGFVLLADTFLSTIVKSFVRILFKTFGLASPALAVAKQHGDALGEIWRKLSQRQKPKKTMYEALSFNRDNHIESHFDSKNKNAVDIEEIPEKGKGADKTKPAARQKAPASNVYVPPSYENYVLPPLDLLDEPQYSYSAVQNKVIESKARALEKLLSEFNINARVVEAETGPVITMFELELSAGVKVGQISALANDMARALGAGAVRVVAPLPGKHTIGIEVPNSEKEKVRIKDLIQMAPAKSNDMGIPLFLGKDSSGDALVSDLTGMPHLLIAGTTGSGKSVCINSIITSILLTRRPDEVKMILIDPKMVEMTAFNTIPHLMSPIVTETQRAVQILEWATVKMDERYAILSEARVKNIREYNGLGAEEIIARFDPDTPEEEAKIPKKLAFIVIIIDELADLMMTASKEIEAYIVRLAQKSRAVGIHIVLATQRPQATVVTGLIKSNMPTRVGFRVAARMDSRIILDQNGAETLLGEGDMLFLKPGTSDLIRAQGTFVDEREVKRIVKHLKEIAEPQFHPELTQLNQMDLSDMPKDELFDDAVRVVLETKRGSVSLLQRRLSVGYARASRMIEMMASLRILGEYKGSQAREVIVTLEEYEQMMAERGDIGGEVPGDDEHDAGQEDDNAPAYITEGQKGYVSIDNEEE